MAIPAFLAALAELLEATGNRAHKDMVSEEAHTRDEDIWDEDDDGAEDDYEGDLGIYRR